MSGLEDVLGGARASGVYQETSPANVAELRADAEGAGWRFVHLDTSSVDDKAGFLDAASRAFGLPGYFGRNWDALADSLGDVDGERGTVVVWDGWSSFAAADEKSFATALEIIRERAGSPGAEAFVVLMRGDRPWDDEG
ncbi:MAG TPA: barstar family protein [Gaiellaceae bacterium]